MKKSNKMPEFNREQLMKDFNKIIDLVNNLENQDLTKINIKTIEEQTNQIKKEIEDRYNPLIEKFKNNLGTKK
jgi:Asp-tRNA(Asn)/Glu-tRNA(Gln) amidotransferase C subunit